MTQTRSSTTPKKAIDSSVSSSSRINSKKNVVESSEAKSSKVFTYKDLRANRDTNSCALIAIHGKVYDITTFIDRHPGGAIIKTALGRDGTILFETHHNLVDDKGKVLKTLEKMQVGVLKDYKAVADFESPFALKMLERVREVVKGKNHRESFYGTTSVIFFYVTFFALVALAFINGNLWIAPLMGASMSVGHLAGHAGNHWSLSSKDWVNGFISVTCTSLWGLREKYWEFSHLISHHCYNYTDRDYIMEQHVPLKYFRVRESDAWRPYHAYQHLVYLTTPFTAFFLGFFMRLDCAPWIFFSPLLSFLKRNKDSPAPAPQFFASGSNVDESMLSETEDGIGGPSGNFVVFDTFLDNVKSIILSNVIWMPLFFWTWHRHGLLHAFLLNSIAFGTQASIVTKSLLTQHLAEDIKLEPYYSSSDDWYGMQVEASTSIHGSAFYMWMTYAISYQTEHHMFPSLNPLLLIEVQPIVARTAREFNLHYNELPNQNKAFSSVYRQFKKLSIKPIPK